MQTASRYRLIIAIQFVLLLIFMGLAGYYFVRFHYVNIQIGDTIAKVEIFEQMERQVETASSREEAVDSLRYALLYYYGNGIYQTKDSPGEYLTDLLRYNTADRMVKQLRARYPDSPVQDLPSEWIKAYGDENTKKIMEDAEQTDWYKKWYGQ